MKKAIFLFIIGLFLSCSNDRFNDNIQADFQEANIANKEYLRDYSEALKYAQDVVFGENTKTRTSLPSVRNHFMYTPTMTRSANNDIIAQFYIINFEEDKGFAIIAADKRTTPVYAYSDNGNIDSSDLSKNPGWIFFMNSAADYYVAKLDTSPKLTGDNPILKYGDVAAAATQVINGVECKVTETTEKSYAGDILSTEWNQTSPYNNYFPTATTDINGNPLPYYYNEKSAVGCSSIALGQVMAYHKHPDAHNGHTYNWNLILKKKSYYIGETSDAANEVAKLLYDIAVTGHAIMGEATSMSTSNMLDVLKSYKYKFEYSAYSVDKVYNSLSKKYPVVISGATASGGRHVWIIDKIQRIRNCTNYHYPQPPYTIFKRDVGDTFYFHCNWGWGPDCSSSAFCLNVFEARTKDVYDRNVTIIYDIQPE